jgi:hypothetical protein
VNDNTPTIFGMSLDVDQDDAIITCQPVAGFVVIKALNDDGEVCYLSAATDGLKSVECLGMARYVMLKLERGLMRDEEDE